MADLPENVETGHDAVQHPPPVGCDRHLGRLCCLEQDIIPLRAGNARMGCGAKLRVGGQGPRVPFEPSPLSALRPLLQRPRRQRWEPSAKWQLNIECCMENRGLCGEIRPLQFDALAGRAPRSTKQSVRRRHGGSHGKHARLLVVTPISAT